MAILVEEETYEVGIYQLEMTDPVQGGPNGIDNLQAKQLANRTKWLKAAIDLIAGSTFEAAKAIKLKTARKINGVDFDGTSDITIIDPSAIKVSDINTSRAEDPGDTDAFAYYDSFTGLLRKVTWANIKNLLWASPILTGTPTAPILPPSDNSAKLATTAYVHGRIPGPFAASSVNEVDITTAETTRYESAHFTVNGGYVFGEASCAINHTATTSNGIFMRVQLICVSDNAVLGSFANGLDNGNMVGTFLNLRVCFAIGGVAIGTVCKLRISYWKANTSGPTFPRYQYTQWIA